MIDAPNIAPITRRLLKHYRHASAADIARGRAWYDDARAFCSALSAGTSYRLEDTAAVVAILSPRITWSQNKSSAAAVVAAHAAGAGADSIVVPALGANVRRAFAALEGTARPAGPKVSAFYRAILGDTDAITLDVWAYRAAVRRDVVTRVQERAAVLEAYRRAARHTGEAPRDLQAIVWCVVRGAHE